MEISEAKIKMIDNELIEKEALNVRDRIQKELDEFQNKYGTIIEIEQTLHQSLGSPFYSGSMIILKDLKIAGTKK